MRNIVIIFQNCNPEWVNDDEYVIILFHILGFCTAFLLMCVINRIFIIWFGLTKSNYIWAHKWFYYEYINENQSVTP